MRRIGAAQARRRRVITALVVMAAGATAHPGIANASPTFDVDGYSGCTAAAVPAAGASFDSVVTTCCVQHAGVPANTNFGMGCVAPGDSTAVDYRPTIVLPTRPVPSEDEQAVLDELIELPTPDPFAPIPPP